MVELRGGGGGGGDTGTLCDTRRRLLTASTTATTAVDSLAPLAGSGLPETKPPPPPSGRLSRWLRRLGLQDVCRQCPLASATLLLIFCREKRLPSCWSRPPRATCSPTARGPGSCCSLVLGKQVVEVGGALVGPLCKMYIYICFGSVVSLAQSSAFQGHAHGGGLVGMRARVHSPHTHTHTSETVCCFTVCIRLWKLWQL